MRHVIITCCDEKYGDFLTEHWLRSLQENVNLKNIDIIVIDYGLSKVQKSKLSKKNVLVIKCKRDGFPNSIKFRDMRRILTKKPYDQVLTCDGGDIIFQSDISHLFNTDKREFRGSVESMTPPFGWMCRDDCFDKETYAKIRRLLKGKRLVNAGLILAPHDKFMSLCKECSDMIDKAIFGPDTLAVNYIFYRDGFVCLDQRYNFIFNTTTYGFLVKDGEFFLDTGEKIPVVHNAGMVDALRVVKNFGYGKDQNRFSRLKHLAEKLFLRVMSLFS